MSENEFSSTESYCPTCDTSFSAEYRACPEDGTRLIHLQDNESSLVGEVLDSRYTIREKIGEGGMGSVYRAWQSSVGREVAVKVIDPQLSGNKNIAKRFFREAKLASQLSQPNTVTVIDFGQSEKGMLYLVMELLDGTTIEEMLEDTRFSEKRVIRIGIQLCDALEAAHNASIVHRDLKPSNILILKEPPGRDLLKVLDFGLAKLLEKNGDSLNLTDSNSVLGTPYYLSPEVAQGLPADYRSDLYSLGVILYELTVGFRPFVGKTVAHILSMHMDMAPPAMPQSVNSKIVNIIFRLLEKQPEDRFQAASEVRSSLLEIVLSESQQQLAISKTRTSANERLGQESMAFANTEFSPIPATIFPVQDPTGTKKKWREDSKNVLFLIGLSSVILLAVVFKIFNNGTTALTHSRDGGSGVIDGGATAIGELDASREEPSETIPVTNTSPTSALSATRNKDTAKPPQPPVVTNRKKAKRARKTRILRKTKNIRKTNGQLEAPKSPPPPKEKPKAIEYLLP